MSLIVLQLSAGDEAVDASVLAVLREFLATLRVGRGPQAAGARGPEPALVVPEDEEPWRDEDLRPYADGGHVLVSESALEAAGADERAVRRLREALDRALCHRAEARRLDPDARMDPPALLVVPVLVVAEGLASEATAERLARLARVARWLERVGTDIAGGGLSPQAGGVSDLDVVLAPWLWLTRPPDTARLPAELFTGVPALGVDRMEPVVYAGMASDGRRRTWDGFGRARLLADLFFLHGLSGSRVALRDLFPRLDEGTRRLHTFHSALLEYPLNELLAEARLASLISGSDKIPALLPEPAHLGGLAEAAKDSVAGQVKESAAALEDLARSGISKDRFAFGGQYLHRPAPDFDNLGPARDRWQGFVDDGPWPVVSPARAADALHTQVHEALRACARASLDDVMDEALNAAQVGIGALLKRLEQQLSETIEAKTSTPGDPERTRKAVGRTLALLRGVLRAVSVHVDEPPVPADPEVVLEGFRAERAAWVQDEERLLEAGCAQPSRGGFWLEVGAVGLAVVAAAVLSSVFAFIPLLLGGGLTYLLFVRRRRQLGEYFQSWKALGDDYRRRADAAAAGLVEQVDVRVRQVKLLAFRDLRRALQAAEARLLTELHGLIGLVKTEQAILARKRRDRSEEAAVPGRFRFLPDVRIAALDHASMGRFHEKLTLLLKRTLCVSGVPDRIPVHEYEQILGHMMVASQEQAVEEAHAAAACDALQACVGYALNPEEMCEVGTFGVDFRNEKRYALLGRSLAPRFGVGLAGVLGSLGEESGRCFLEGGARPGRPIPSESLDAVLHALAPEVAVVVSVRHLVVRADPSGEVARG